MYRVLIDKIKNPDDNVINVLRSLSIHIPLWTGIITSIIVIGAFMIYRLSGSDSEIVIAIIYIARICVNIAIGLTIISVFFLWSLRAWIYHKRKRDRDSV